MALTESTTIALGTKAAPFELIDTIDGHQKSLEHLKGKKGTVVLFICNHCPFVIHINQAIVALANEYIKKEIGFIAISSNDISTHPQDGPEYMKVHALKNKYPFPYLYDPSQEVAKAYKAACTPDFYVFDANLASVYHGRLDDSRPGSPIPVTGGDLRKSLDLLLEGVAPVSIPLPSMGCNIKWK